MANIWNRRTILFAGIAAVPSVLYAGAIGAGAVGPCGSALEISEAALASTLRLGEAYLNSGLGADEKAYLLQVAMSDETTYSTRLKEQLVDYDAMVERDFVTGQTTNCQGWVLSETEARICAQIYLRSKHINGVSIA